ncbi:outer membrane lipoprotein-sorting protein [candidate division KSB1 bacterium]
MKKHCAVIVLSGFLAAITFNSVPVLSQDITGYQVMEIVDKRLIPADSQSRTVMKLIDKRGKVRERTISTYRFGDDKQIMWFQSPADVRGSSFLRISYDDRDDDMWIYLPSFGKVRRIASHAKKGSFMGSDFTYEDIGDRKLGDYTYTLLREESVGDQECWVVESIPSEGVVTDYSKIVSWVWKTGEVPVKEEFYDKRGALLKVMNRQMIKVGEYWMFKEMSMENLKNEHKTEIVIDNIEVNVGLDENLFDTRSLTRIH